MVRVLVYTTIAVREIVYTTGRIGLEFKFLVRIKDSNDAIELLFPDHVIRYYIIVTEPEIPDYLSWKVVRYIYN